MDGKEYTCISFKREKNLDVYAICYYWEDGKRKSDKFEITQRYFYADPDIELDKEKYRIIKGFTNVDGKIVNKVIPLDKITPDDYKFLQSEYRGKVYETDVKAIDRWLWDVKPKFSENVRKWYIDIETLRDINGQYSTPDLAENPIASITIYDSVSCKYYVFLLNKEESKKMEVDDKKIYMFKDERVMLNGFIKLIKALDPDIFTGWNVIGYDLPYLINRGRNLGIDMNDISPLYYINLRIKDFKGRLNFNVNIKGRGIVDLIEIARQFWLGTDVGYSLEAISRKYLNEGKIDIGDIDKAYKENFWRFVEYNVKDVELCIKLDNKLNLIKDMQEFQKIISINLEETIIAGRIINYYIKQHTPIVLNDAYTKDPFDLPGGYVHPVSKGIFKNVKKFDFASHYPSVIRSYNISTDSIVYDPSEDQKKDLIHFKCKYQKVSDKSTSGWRIILPGDSVGEDVRDFEVWFKKDRGIITKITDELTEERFKQKRTGNKSRSTVLKRMINSIYGQFGYKNSRFFNKECAMSITLICQWLSRNIINMIEARKIGKIIMGDTDSMAIDLYPNKTEADIAGCVQEVFDRSKKEHNIDKVYSNLELEATIDKMILFGVKKKYAQLINGKIKIQGLELIRKDFPEALKEFQKELIDEIFKKDHPGLSDVRNIRKEIELRIRSNMNKKNHSYYSIPTVIRKPISEYATETAEKKALRNSKLNISVNEDFYILPCIGDKDLAYKSIDELEKFNYQPDYQRIVDKIFSNVNIFEELFIKQSSLLEY